MSIARNLGMATLVLASVVVPLSSSQARAINFSFVPSSSLTLYAPNENNATYVEAVTGSFTYDSVTNTASSVNIALTGGVNVNFLYSFSSFGNDSKDFGVSAAGANNSNGILAYLQFTKALDGVSTLAPLTGSAVYNTHGNLFGRSATGGVGVSAVPEPAAWALMLVGFGGLGGALRLKRRSTLVEA